MAKTHKEKTRQEPKQETPKVMILYSTHEGGENPKENSNYQLSLLQSSKVDSNGKIPHLTITASVEQYQQEFHQIKDRKMTVAQDLAAVEELNEKYKTLRWVWTTVTHKSQLKSKSVYSGISLGCHTVKVEIDSAYVGGGILWLEPVFDGELPTGEAPYGCYVNAVSADASIVTVEWHEYAEDGKGKLLKADSAKKFREGVQLHIYTKDLYGQQLNVQIKKVPGGLFSMFQSDIILPLTKRKDGELMPAQKKTEPKEEEKGNTEELTKEDSGDADQRDTVFFSAPVLVQTMLRSELPKEYLEVANDIQDYKFRVQKAIVNVFLDPLWREGDHISILAVVSCRAKLPDNENKNSGKLPVGPGTSPANSPLARDGNMPVMIGSVETNAVAFHPCHYEEVGMKITPLQNPTPNNPARTVVLYKQKGTEPPTVNQFVKPNYIELVCGGKESGSKLSIDLKGVNTILCTHPKQKHTNHIIDIEALEKKEVGKKKEDTPFKKENFEPVDPKCALELEVAYPYPETPIESESAKLMYKYLLPHAEIGHTHPTIEIPITTCRNFENVAKIKLYPDIRVTLGLGISFDMIKEPEKSAAMKKAEKILEKVKKKATEKFVMFFNIPDGLKKYLSPGKEDGLVKFEARLKADYNRRSGEDLWFDSVDFMQYLKEKHEKKVKKLADFLVILDDIIHCGSENATPASPSDTFNLKKRFRKTIDRLSKVVDKDIASIKLIPPTLLAYISWQLVEGNNHKALQMGRETRAGYLFHGGFNFDPLIGFDFTLDFIALIEKIHPYVRAVITIIEAAGNLAGWEMDLSLKVKGVINLQFLDMTYNALTNELGGALVEKNAPLAETDCVVTLTFNGSVTGCTTIPIFWFFNVVSKVEVKGDAVFNANSAITVLQKLKYSSEPNKEGESGMYWEMGYHFDGLILKYGADFKVNYIPADTDDKNNEDSHKEQKTGLDSLHTKVVVEGIPYQHWMDWYL